MRVEYDYQRKDRRRFRVTCGGLGCSESVGPQNRSLGGLRFDVAAGSVNGTLGQSGTLLIKGFDGGNPRQGDAIIATFVWLGSSDIIASVTDVKTTNPYTPIGNTFNRSSTSHRAGLDGHVRRHQRAGRDRRVRPRGPGQPLTTSLGRRRGDLGMEWGLPDIWNGVGRAPSASGSGSTPTVADPGSIPVAAGALAYGVSMTNGALGIDRPAGFTPIGTGSDAAMVVDAGYALPASAGSVDPQWTWVFNSPSTWLATVFALNEAPRNWLSPCSPAHRCHVRRPSSRRCKSRRRMTRATRSPRLTARSRCPSDARPERSCQANCPAL